MSGSTRAITLNLSVQNAEKLQADLRAMGTAGEDALKRLEAAAANSNSRGKGLSQVSVAVKETGTQFGNMTPKIQQAGYQIQDFAVQVQGGTSALTALAQQGSQFLGAFGPGGAIAGAVLTVGILALKLLDAAQSVEEINKANRAWIAGQTAINALLETAIEKQSRMRRERTMSAQDVARTDLAQADVRGTQASEAILKAEREIAGLRRQGPGFEGDVANAQQRLASARFDAANADRARSAARAVLDRTMGTPGSYGEGRDLLEGSRRELAEAARTRGMNPQQEAVEQARIRGENEAREKGLSQLETEEHVRNRVKAATDNQAYANAQAAEAEAKRAAAAGRRTQAEESAFQAALRSGQAEITRSAEALRLAEALATAESPRAALLARQTFEVERATVSIRARIATETDPKIRTALQEQVDLITKQRTEAVALEETTRNRNALYQQGQAFARQTSDRAALGMTPDERARYLGEFGERQSLEGQGLSTTSPEALQRIKNAGELAYGDEQMRKLKDFTGAITSMGTAFTDAFSSAIFDGKKFGDVLTTLEKQLASSILKATLGKYLENAVGGLASQGMNAVGNWWNGVDANHYSAPIGPTPSGATLSANGNVMTEFGPLTLRKYDMGGVARSPQVSIFGEGRKPEAYVPLPDGRSIPVTMNGGGGGGPVIQIDARGADAGVEQRIRMVLASQMPGIIAASRADLTGRVNRGGDIARVFGRR